MTGARRADTNGRTGITRCGSTWAPTTSFSVPSTVFDLLQDRFSMNYIFAFDLGLGFAAGLRSFTPPAVVAWAAHLGWLNLNNSPLAFMGSIITAVIFSILALFELFLDLQPTTPKRTAPFPLLARILMGGL